MAESMSVPSQDIEDLQNHQLCKLSKLRWPGGPTNSDAPIARLPTEILAEIFHQGYISESSQKYGMAFRSSICLVTRHWREVAIDTSSLWTAFVVHPDHSPEFVGMCLHRSKDRPLVIRFAYSDPTAIKNLHDILPILTLSASRWRELTICVHDDEGLQPILRSLRDLEVPLLEVMSVTAWYTRRDDVVTRIFQRGAPRLSNVFLGCVRLRDCWPPMNNVTVFNMEGGNMDFEGSQFYEMLEALPSVTDLILQNTVASFVPGDIKRKLMMFSLRRLVIHAGHGFSLWEDTYLECLLSDVLFAPNLETLVIIGGVYETVRDAFASVAASPPRFPALTSLELWKTFSSALTQDFLQTLPGLKKLTLIKCARDHVLRLLCEEGGPVLLPHLHTLTIESHLQPRTDYDHTVANLTTIGLICGLVATRARLGIPIQSLRLGSGLYTADPERTEWLQDRVQVEDTGVTTLQWR